jgi:hypothetical protein
MVQYPSSGSLPPYDIPAMHYNLYTLYTSGQPAIRWNITPYGIVPPGIQLSGRAGMRVRYRIVLYKKFSNPGGGDSAGVCYDDPANRDDFLAGSRTRFNAVDTLDQIKTRLRDFAAARDWDQFHSPKNLAMALIVEADKLGIDIEQAVNAKIELNEKKYPAEKVRGSAAKYGEFDDGC